MARLPVRSNLRKTKLPDWCRCPHQPPSRFFQQAGLLSEPCRTTLMVLDRRYTTFSSPDSNARSSLITAWSVGLPASLCSGGGPLFDRPTSEFAESASGCDSSRSRSVMLRLPGVLPRRVLTHRLCHCSRPCRSVPRMSVDSWVARTPGTRRALVSPTCPSMTRGPSWQTSPWRPI